MDQKIGEGGIQWMQIEVQRHREMGGLRDVDMVEVEEAMVRGGCGRDILKVHRRSGESRIAWNDELEGMVDTRGQVELSSCTVENGE